MAESRRPPVGSERPQSSSPTRQKPRTMGGPEPLPTDPIYHKDGRTIYPDQPKKATDPFGKDPYGDIAAYENFQFDYPIELMQARGLTPQSYDLQRQSALQTVQGGAQSGALGAMSSLASTGGLSEADRQAIQSQGQRQRVNLSQGAMAPIDQMQAENLYNTQQYNTQQGQQTADYNQKILNDKARDLAVQKENHATNMYQRRLVEAILQRQLEKSAEIAAKQK